MKRSFESIERSFYVSDLPVERLIGLPVTQRLYPSGSLENRERERAGCWARTDDCCVERA